MTGKESVRGLFAGKETARPAFIPWVYCHAARLQQTSLREIGSDAGKLSRALMGAQALYGYDAICSAFDLTLEAEACGCQVGWSDSGQPPVITGRPSLQAIQSTVPGVESRGRLPAVMESLRRLKILVGQTVAIVAVVTSPLSIAARLSGADPLERLKDSPAETRSLLNAAGQVITAVTRAYCQLEPDIVAITDEYLLKLPAEHRSDVLPMFKTVGNLARFFNARSVLVTRAGPGDKLGILGDLNLDGVAIGGQVEPSELVQLKRRGLAVGLGIPLSVNPQASMGEFVARYASVLSPRRSFLTTEWDVPYETPPETMHALARLAAGVRAVAEGPRA